MTDLLGGNLATVLQGCDLNSDLGRESSQASSALCAQLQTPQGPAFLLSASLHLLRTSPIVRYNVGCFSEAICGVHPEERPVTLKDFPSNSAWGRLWSQHKDTQQIPLRSPRRVALQAPVGFL